MTRQPPVRVESHDNELPQRLDDFQPLGRDSLPRFGGTLLIPPLTFAHVLIATSDSVVLRSQLNDVDLYRPTLEMYLSVIKMPGRRNSSGLG